MNKSRKKRSPAPMTDSGGIKDFLDMIAPSVIDFKVDHFLCGNTYRCVWALREYPTSTDEQAILRHLGEMDGVTIRIYTRQVTASEEKRIIHNAANRNRMSRSSTEDLQQTVTAEANLQDVVTLVSTMHRNREPLLHCAVFLELKARIRALLRRAGNQGREAQKRNYLTGGNIKLDLDARNAYKNGELADLTAKEFDVIEFLMRNPNRVYSREALLDTIWAYEYRSDIRTVDVHIRRLREKLEDRPAQPQHILTKWGVGYYFKS